jgi:regulatory protein
MAEAVGEAAASARALEIAYRHLNRRERTVHELRQHLISREIDMPLATSVVEELIEVGYLDDARYARMFAQDKRELEQWGSGRIRRALLAKGITREVVEEALAEPHGSVRTAGDELERAVSLLRQRFPDPPRDRPARQRALGVLLRRGYEPDLARDALAAHTRDEA